MPILVAIRTGDEKKEIRNLQASEEVMITLIYLISMQILIALGTILGL